MIINLKVFEVSKFKEQRIEQEIIKNFMEKAFKWQVYLVNVFQN